MIALYIVLGCIGFFLCFNLILALIIHKKVFGKRWEPDGIVQYYTKESYQNFESSPIVIPSKNGSLRGYMYFYPKEKYQGILVFAHGMWGSHNSYLQEIECLAKNGFKVIGFDYFGTELSDGKNIRGLGNSLKSLDIVISYVKKTYPNEKIYVMGHSWGGFAAIGIAKYHPDLERIVAMSPFLKLTRIFGHLLPKICAPVLPFLLCIDAMHCGKYSLVNGMKVLKTTKVKTMLLHSTDDPMVPFVSSTGYVQKKLVNPSLSYEIVEGKKHNPDYSVEALAYTNTAFAELKQISDSTERLEYRKKMDYHKMGEIDQNIFNSIVEFLKKE